MRGVPINGRKADRFPGWLLFAQRLRDVGLSGRGKVEDAGREGRGTLVFVDGGDAVALGEDGFGAVVLEIVINPDGEFLDHPLEPAAARSKSETVAVVFARGFDGVELVDALEIEARRESGDGVVEEGLLPEGVELGFLEVRIVDPEFLAVADRDTGTFACDFAAKFAGNLKGDVAFAGQRFV